MNVQIHIWGIHGGDPWLLGQWTHRGYREELDFDLSSGLLISMVTLSKLLTSYSSVYLSIEWASNIAATQYSCCNN